MSFATPAGWTNALLGNLLNFKYGKALPDKDRSGQGFPVYGSNGVVGWHANALTAGPTIVIGRKGSVGALQFSNIPCSPIDTTYYVDEVPGNQFRFWFYRLKSFDLASLNKSTAIPGLSRGDAYQISVDLPPLAEQKRIADKLDTVLTRVDAVNTRLARVAPLLKRFRQSVLAAATSGRLTEDWRATEDFGEVRSLGELVSCLSGSGFPPSLQGRPEGELPFAKVSDISNAVLNSSGRLASAVHYVSLQEASAIKAKVIPIGSTVFAKIGEGLKLNRRAQTVRPVLIDNNCMALVPDESLILPDYLYLQMKTVDLGQFAIATAIPSVRRGDIESVRVSLPPIGEQIEIIRRVETLFAFADRLEARLAQAQTAATRLPPALLAKAFRGELVPQDPNDEPAAELLRRLAQAPAAASPRKGRKAAGAAV